MNDKSLMEDMLLLEKGVCDLYMHGALESSSENVHRAFNAAFSDSVCMQNEVYDKMASKGWYQIQNADQNQVSSVRQKFASTC